MKGARVEAHQRVEFIPIDYPDSRKLRSSFKKLRRACHPSSAALAASAGGAGGIAASAGGMVGGVTSSSSSSTEKGFLSLVEESEWLEHLQTVMQIAGAVTYLMDSMGSSVMISLEDGWDVTAQVSSLAQICLDPYYRTIQVFLFFYENMYKLF
jgi:myotubularin-related protein 5/13